MAQRRVLPSRSTRGVRPKITPQEEEADNKVYKQLFENASKQINKKQQGPINNPIPEQNTIDYKMNISLNRMKYPFSRGYHYFYNLNDFPRAEGHPSYAVDEDNIFGYTYSQEDKLLKQDRVGQILNRKYIHLPLNSQVDQRRQKQRDKNVCHGYLFENQNKKYALDKSLIELKHILNNLEMLIDTGKIKNYSIFKRDLDLYYVFQDEMEIDGIKQLLEKKIKILKERKDNMKNILLNEDKIYFYPSLNQQLHNRIQQLQYTFGLEKIIIDLFSGDTTRKNIQDSQKYSVKELQNLFKYYRTQNVCFSKEILTKLSGKINRDFFRLDESDNYALIIPSNLFCFPNEKLMEFAQKILANRLVSMSESSYYVGKSLWMKLFKRNLNITKEIKTLNRQEYDKSFYSCLSQFMKWYNKREQVVEKEDYPILDQLFQQNSLKIDQRPKKYLLKYSQENELIINPRQYACIVYFYHIYNCLSHTFKFIEGNETFLEVIGSEHYHKIYHSFTQVTNKPELGLLEICLKKLTQFIMRVDIDFSFHIKWVYDKGVGLIWKDSIPEWETQKSESQNEEENEEDAVCKK